MSQDAAPPDREALALAFSAAVVAMELMAIVCRGWRPGHCSGIQGHLGLDLTGDIAFGAAAIAGYAGAKRWAEPTIRVVMALSAASGGTAALPTVRLPACPGAT